MKLQLTVHIGGIGDKKADPNAFAGFESGERRIEGFTLTTDAAGVTYQAVEPDGTLGPVIAAGGYCGTRGKQRPLHGFVVHAARGALQYRGVFQDGFRSDILPPGALCASPGGAALVAMQVGGGTMATQPAALPPPAPMRPATDDGGLAALDEALADISLIAHVAGRGDIPSDAQGWCGEAGSTRHIEGFFAAHGIAGWARDVRYRAVLPDGSLGKDVPGGGYCGTRGKGQALHGFVLDAEESRRDLAGLAYEGVFRDGFASGILAPGQICASPSRAALLAMRIKLTPPPETSSAAENIRLVIWDLDETFWGGTLTESGIAWREDHAEIVRALAARGIISSICSKNDPADVQAILAAHGMAEYFVFPSISWESKGPRLAALVAAAQLRAPTVLFIDDNPMNRAEALRFVPGLQVADETCIAGLLENPLVHGKPDGDLKRLAQYRLLQRRQADQAKAAGDTTAFLRESGITVSLEFDIAPHLDRAVELINRTNQLNFTKARLPDHPEDPNAAREALRTLLSRHNIQAALVHVRDRYGDYGYCGLYVIRRDSVGAPELMHFAFSCRILGMGVETWLYRALNRPSLTQAGRVASNPADESLAVDWINAGTAESGSEGTQPRKALSHVLLRGACELRPLAHYFALASDRVIEEFDTWRMDQMPLLNHSVIATQAIAGIDARAIRDAAPLGYIPEDFRPFVAGAVPPGPAVWVLGFAIEQLAPMFRHNETGVLLPWSPVGLSEPPDTMMAGGAHGKADPGIVAHLRGKFSYVGRRPNAELDTIFRASLRTLFARAGDDIAIFVVLANARGVGADGSARVFEPMRHFNAVVAEIAGAFSNVELLAPVDFMTAAEIAAMKEPNHFDRIVYYRMFRHIIEKTGKG